VSYDRGGDDRGSVRSGPVPAHGLITSP
jgi:hypothetical protein